MTAHGRTFDIFMFLCAVLFGWNFQFLEEHLIPPVASSTVNYIWNCITKSKCSFDYRLIDTFESGHEVQTNEKQLLYEHRNLQLQF